MFTEVLLYIVYGILTNTTTFFCRA